MIAAHFLRQATHYSCLLYSQVVELDARGPLEFEYDPEWLAIMRSTNETLNLRHQHRYVCLC